MFRPRIIPVLLLKKNILYKSRNFKDFKYIGDPINATKIFNDSKADELVFLDITATKENRIMPLEFVRNVGEEANMPFAVGGGVRSLQHIMDIINAGGEKVIINSYAAQNPSFIKEATDEFGSSTISVCIDVKKRFLGKVQTWINGGTSPTGYSPVDFAKMMEQNGAGELIIQSIERDGMMDGYDIELLKSISQAVSIPVVGLGGAGKINDFKKAYSEAHVSGCAAGSLFVYKGSRNGVLINYPEKRELSFNS